jgi:hypothetical protein
MHYFWIPGPLPQTKDMKVTLNKTQEVLSPSSIWLCKKTNAE